MAGAPAVTESGEEQLRPLGSSASNRRAVSETRANLVRPLLAPRPGVNADQCVLCTLQDANFRGYDCLLLEDCVATTSPDYCMAATIYNIRQCFGFVIGSGSLAHELAGNDRA